MYRVLSAILLVAAVCLCCANSFAQYPATDNFNRANAGTLGANWTADLNNWSISSNTAIATAPTAYTISAYSAQSFSNDQTTTITVANAQTTTFLGPCVRLSLIAASGYCVVARGLSGGNTTVSKFVTGTRTDLCTSSSPDPYMTGDTLALKVVGTTLTYTHNGSTVAGCLAFTDASYSSGAPGMLGFNNGSNPTVTLFSSDCIPTCNIASGGQIIGGPLLPQVRPSVVYPNESLYPAPTSLSNGANLQTALTAAGCGTILSLTHGGTFTAGATPYTLPNNSCACHTDPTKWVIIRSDAYAGGSVRGVKIDPSSEYANLAHITGSDINYLFAVTGPSPSASCYWFGPGLDLTETHNTANALIAWGDGGFTSANFPHDLVVDHSYLHGIPTNDIFRCLLLNGNWIAVVDSYCSDIHHRANDSQGFESSDGFGPFLYQNNTISAAAENTMFGGSPSNGVTLVADITIKGNYYFKPLTWRIGSPTYAGIFQIVKDLIEFKNAQRVLVTGNIFDTTWQAGQPEFEIFNTNCSGSPPSVNFNQDITQTLNLFKHGPQGVIFGGCGSTSATQPNHRMLFSNNLYEDIDGCVWANCSSMRSVQLDPGTGAPPGSLFAGYDLWQVHETYAAANMSAGYIFSGNAGNNILSYGIQFRDSIIFDGGNGAVFGNGVGAGNIAITTFAPNGNFTNNCMYGTDANNYSFSNFAGRQTPANAAAVFVNPGVDFHVAASSVCHLAASDNTDMGACIDCVNAAVAPVVQTLANLHTVTNISPSTFTHTGGTTLTITGTNFIVNGGTGESGLGVIVGGAGPTSPISTDSCGFNNPGQYTITAFTDTSHFTYTGGCVVVMASPVTVALNDTINKIVNSGLTSGTINRYSPGNACTSVSVVSSTSITCTTPAASGTVTTGPVSVFVSQFGIPVQSAVFGNYN